MRAETSRTGVPVGPRLVVVQTAHSLPRLTPIVRAEQSGFGDPGDNSVFSWDPQANADEYQLAWSDDDVFFAPADTCITTTETSVSVPDPPLNVVVRFILVRATAPNEGSWGLNSANVERTVVCQ